MPNQLINQFSRLLIGSILSCVMMTGWGDDLSSLTLQEKMAYFFQEAVKAKEEAPAKMKAYPQDIHFAENQQKNLVKVLANHQYDAINENKTINTPGHILIFVSFSMPTESLKAYLNDGKKVHAAIFIRGLVHDSFKETALAMKTLIDDSHKNGVLLDPVLFRQLHISHVPTIVVVPNNIDIKEATADNVDQLQGDVTLLYALSYIEKNSASTQSITSPAIHTLENV